MLFVNYYIITYSW